MQFKLRSPWIGRWLMLVALIHLAFGALVFAEPLQAIGRTGWWGGVERDATLMAVTWFVLFAPPLFTTGLAIDAIERQRGHVPTALAWWLLAVAALGAALMPASGFYLVLPAVVAIFLRARPPAARP